MQKLRNRVLRILLLFLFLNIGNSISVYAQYNTPSDSTSKVGSVHMLTIQPVIGGGVGMLSYIGNIKASSSNIQSPSNGRIGYTFSISQALSPTFELNLSFLHGSVAETEHTTSAFWNFQSSLNGGGVSTIINILPKQSVTPYVIIGIESYEFQSRADVYDAQGNEYYSWSDGTLRSLPQNSPEASTAKILTLDYAYATDIRQLNGNGTGPYTQQAFAIPIGAGFKFRVAQRADLMVGSTLHYTFTDHIDGLAPLQQGVFRNDMFLYTYATLRIDLSRNHPKIIWDPAFEASLLQDSVAPDVPKNIDTTDLALQKRYDMYYDSTGEFGEHIVDSFSWHNPGWIGVSSGNQITNNRVIANYPVTTNTPVPVSVEPTHSVSASAKAEAEATAALATSSESMAGLEFRVQYGAFKGTPSPAFMAMFNKIPNNTVQKDDNGISHYMAASHNNMKDATADRDQAKANGANDAFIKALYNGHFISMTEAKKKLNK